MILLDTEIRRVLRGSYEGERFLAIWDRIGLASDILTVDLLSAAWATYGGYVSSRLEATESRLYDLLVELINKIENNNYGR